MTLLKTSFWNGIAVSIRILTALLLNKILAIYVGPAGYAIIGQFQNVISTVTTLATGAVNTGVTKYTAEYYNDEPRQRALWGTAGCVVLAGSLVASIVIVLFRRPLAIHLLQDQALSGVFLWLAAGLVLFCLNALLLAILNGKKEIRRYVTSNIAGSLLGLLLTGFLAWKWGLYGALVALSINQSIVFFVTLVQCRTTIWFKFSDLLRGIDPRIARNLGKFAIMALTSAVVVPLSHILVRNHVADVFGWHYAGCWDAMSKVSTIYLSLVTTSLSLYYLPRIAEIFEREELNSEILKSYRIILPIVGAAALGMYLARDLVVVTLFSPEFLPMRELFPWQLSGDVVKIGSWMLGYVLVGKAMTGWFVVTEVFFSLTFWALCVLLSGWIGFSGLAIAYLLNYALYFVAMYFIVLSGRVEVMNG